MSENSSTSHHSKPSPHQQLRGRWLIAVLLTTAFTTTGALALVVYDPGQHAQNLQQVLALIEQIDRATTQIENQWRMLRRLPISVGRSLGISGRRLHDKLQPTLPEPETQLPLLYDRTEKRLPTEFTGDEIGWLDGERDAWNRAAREGLIAQRLLQNEVFRDQEITVLRVDNLIRTSNGDHLSPHNRPGQTVVLQAHNELLGTLAHETQNLIALRTARLHAEHERHLQTQATNAFHRARREAVMSTWPATGSSR